MYTSSLRMPSIFDMLTSVAKLDHRHLSCYIAGPETRGYQPKESILKDMKHESSHLDIRETSERGVTT